jgi:predicted transcriptional regulator
MRQVGLVRAAAAHLLRSDAGLQVKQVAPLLGRSGQTVCEFSRKARLAMANGGRIAELIEQVRRVLDMSAPAVVEPPIMAEVDGTRGGDALAAVLPHAMVTLLDSAQPSEVC